MHICINIYIYIYKYIYIYIYTYPRFRGASPVYPTPRNREIGFVSFSFSFRACRACERCEAVRRMWNVILNAGPPGSWDPRAVSGFRCPFGAIVAAMHAGFNSFWSLF